jgi:tetratricopeptide (TPR) repeat protein
LSITRHELADQWLDEALVDLADRRWRQALDLLEKAQEAAPKDWVQLLIRHIQQYAVRDKEAELAADDIQFLLEGGQFAQVHLFAHRALEIFGDTQAAPRLDSLRRRAVGFLMLSIPQTDQKGLLRQLRQDYETSLRNGHLAAAWTSLDELLCWTEDAELRRALTDLTNKMDRQEAARRLGWELWRARDRWDDTVAAFEQVATIWRHPQSLLQLMAARAARRQSINGMLAIADVLGPSEIGPFDAEIRLADELATLLRSRFQVVSAAKFREQLRQLGWDTGQLYDESQQRRLAAALPAVRYVLFSRITPWAGITLHLRVVDCQTGLTVLTAQESANDWEDLRRRLPEMVRDMLSREEFRSLTFSESAKSPIEKLTEQEASATFEFPQALLRRPFADSNIVATRPLPPRWNADAIERLQQFLDSSPTIWTDIPNREWSDLPQERYRELRCRAAAVAGELGDDFLRRGYVARAKSQYEFARRHRPEAIPIRERAILSLWLAPEPAPGHQPRVVVFDFAPMGSSTSVPTYWSGHIADHFATYLAPEWEAVDRGEWIWWMGRLGLSFADLLSDPAARIVLARSLNARYFLFGSMARRSSWDIRAYLVEPETGSLVSASRVSAKDGTELKTRLPDLCRKLKYTPQERKADESLNAQWAWLLNEIEQARDRDRNLERVLELAERGLTLRPESTEMRQIQFTALQAQQVGRWDAQRMTDDEPFDNTLEEFRRQQVALAQQLEKARWEAAGTIGPSHDGKQSTDIPPSWLTGRLSLASEATKAGRWRSAVAQWRCILDAAPTHNLAGVEAATAIVRHRREIEQLQHAIGAQIEQARRGPRDWIARGGAVGDSRRQERQMAQNRRQQRFREKEDEIASRLGKKAKEAYQRRHFEEALALGIGASRLQTSSDIAQQIELWLDEFALSESERSGVLSLQAWQRSRSAEKEILAALKDDLEKRRRKWHDLVQQAEDELQRQQFRQAETLFRKAWEIQADDRVRRGWEQAIRGRSVESKQEPIERSHRMGEMLAAAERSERENRLSDAIKQMTAVLRQSPDNESLWQKWLDLHLKGEVVRYRQSQKRNDELVREIVDLLTRSMQEHKKSERWEAAAINAETMLFFRPRESSAVALRDETVAPTGDLTPEARNKLERYRNAIWQGRRYLAMQEWNEALTEFRQAQVQLPRDKAADGLVEIAQRAMAEANRRTSVDSRRPTLARGDWVLFQSAISQARRDSARGRWTEAKQALAIATRLDASHPEIASLSSVIDTAEQRAIAEAEIREKAREVRRGQLSEAVTRIIEGQVEEARRIVESIAGQQTDDPMVRVVDAWIHVFGSRDRLRK